MKHNLVLRHKRAAKIEESRKILDKAKAEERQLTVEEQKAWDDLHTETRNLAGEIERFEKQEQAEAELREQALRQAAEDARKDGKKHEDAADEKVAAFRSYIRLGREGMDQDERRNLSMGIDTKGGYLAPEQFLAELIKFVDDSVYVRANARVITLDTGEAIGAPQLDTDISDADWTSELSTGTEDTAMAFGKRRLEPRPLAKRILVSRDLLMSAALNPEQLVIDRLGYKFSVTEEKTYLTGSGSNQPLGVFTASNDGVSTARDFSDGNTTTGITFDGLISAKYGLKSQYRGRPSTAWIFHRDAMEQISKLKDGEGQYIWRPSVRDNEPDRILGIPALESEFAPSTFTTGLYVGILGDWQNYWIVEGRAMDLQRLDERYAEINQVGFIGRRRIDAAPVLAEAFARVKLA